MDADNLIEIEQLAAKKEKEWKSATALQISSLQSALKQKQTEYQQLNEMFLKLKADFKYNLKLLQDRDRELKQYDGSFTKAKAIETAHIAEISDSRIKIAKLMDSIEREEQARCEMQRHYRQQLIDQQAEIDAFKTAKTLELEEAFSQISQMKSKHERTESQLKAEIESQRLDMISDFECELRKKDRNVKEKENEMKAEVLAHELKCKLLEKELDIMKTTHAKQAETLEEADGASSKLRKRLQETENDIKDISSIKNARIMELEAKIKNLEAKNLSLVEEYEERRKKLDKDIRMKQSNMDAVRKGFLDKEAGLEDQIRKLQSKVEACEHETRRALWDKNDLDKEHKVIIEKLKAEIQDLSLRFESQEKMRTSSIVTKDVEIQNLKKKEDIMRNELQILKESVENYKKELAAATQKENLLLQSKVQMKLNWQQRCQEIEQKQYAESDGLIRNLTKSRDIAVAEVRKLRRQLGMESDDWDPEISVTLVDQQLQELQSQNDQLKAVVRQMTNDMQNMAVTDKEGRNTDREVGEQKGEFSSEYVKPLEDEIMQLKKKVRKADETDIIKQPIVDPISISHPVPAEASYAHPDVKAHIDSLNKMIGDLRADKTDLSVQLQKLQVRLRHQDSLLNTREADVKKQGGRIQELEYELSSCRRRSEQETDSLKKRVTNLELQLAETRREADEYYKGGIQYNIRATELGNKLSQMTVDAATKAPWMGNFVQSGIVEQLQGEVTQLRKELARTKQELIIGKASKHPSKAAALVKQFHEKLHIAADKISLLMQEKAQLLEIGNSLRAELELLKRNPAVLDESTKENKSHEMPAETEPNKMKQMEDLQYKLTRQELQFAQRASPPKADLSTELPTPTVIASTPVEASHKDKHPQPTHSSLRNSKANTLQFSLSSVGDTSIRNVWNILDQEPSSPSLPCSKENSPHTSANFTEERPVLREVKSTPQVRPLRRPLKKGRTPKIRNYNIKDDKEARMRSDHNRKGR